MHHESGSYGVVPGPGALPGAAGVRGGAHAEMPLEARLDFGDPMSGGGGGGGGEGGSQASLFKRVHRLLRGRYLLTLSMAGVLAGAGAVGGFLSTRPKFEAKGSVQYRFIMPQVAPNAWSQPVQRPEAYVMGQAQLLLSERVLHKAMMSEGWRKLGVGTGPEEQQDLRDALDASLAPATIDLLYVTCRHVDRAYADTAIKEVIRAYEDIFTRQSENVSDAMQQTLLTRQREHEANITQMEDELRQILEREGAGDVQYELESMSRQIAGVREQVRNIELQIATIDETPADASPKAKDLPVDQQRKLSIEQVARNDLTMRRLVDEQREAETRLRQLRTQGYSEQHLAVRRAAARVSQLQAMIDDYAATWSPQGASGTAPLPILPASGQTKEDLVARLEKFRTVLRELEADRAKIAASANEVASLLEKLRLEKARRDEVAQRIQNIETQNQLEQRLQGRVTVLSYGQTPTNPTIDKRKQAAAAGFVLGGGLPVAAMLLLGLVDRRMRYSDDAEESGIPTLLGVLPVLPQELADAEQRAAAAHCVHNIRVMLQLGAEARGGKVWMVTSPTSGDGKTSLSLSLGLSFAASGARTLLIDFDMVGTGLSSSLELRGYHGVVDAIRAGEIETHVVPSGVDDRLFVLPSAAGDDLHASRLSTAAVRRLMAQAREAFDVVIADTGPILGSLEAAMLASQADATVLVVGRGQQQEFVRRAVERIAAVGGRLAGVVFNRATGSDFKRSFSSASQRSVPLALPSRVGQKPARSGLKRASPIARTVADDTSVDTSVHDANGHAEGLAG